MWRKKLALALVLVFMFVAPGSGLAMLPITDAMIKELESLKESGKMSNEYIDHSIIDLVYVSSGSVTSYTYTGNNENLTINKLDVIPTENHVAGDKITRYVFNLTNQYRPDTEIGISVSLPEIETVNVYTYGALKHEAMLAVISGIPDCIANPRLGERDGGSGNRKAPEQTWTDKYGPDVITFTTFELNKKVYTTLDGSTQIMDVAPETTNNKLYVPAKYAAYALGVPEEGIKWKNSTKTVTITYNDKTIAVTIGSTTKLINNEPVEMSTAPYIKHGRTMMEAQYIAKPLGATAEWDSVTKQISIIQTQEVAQGS